MSDNWEYLHNYLPTVVSSLEERTARINLCKTCEHINELKYCDQCNCFMPAKTWVASRKCPIGKW